MHGAPRINTPTPPAISQYRAHHTAFYPISCPRAILSSSPARAWWSLTACSAAPPQSYRAPARSPTQTTAAPAFVSAPPLSPALAVPPPPAQIMSLASLSPRAFPPPAPTTLRAPAFPMRSRVSLSAHPAHKFRHGCAPRAAPINSPCPAEKRHAVPFRAAHAAPFPHSSRHSPFFDTSFPASPRNFRKNSQKIAFFSLQMAKNGL